MTNQVLNPFYVSYLSNCYIEINTKYDMFTHAP